MNNRFIINPSKFISGKYVINDNEFKYVFSPYGESKEELMSTVKCLNDFENKNQMILNILEEVEKEYNNAVIVDDFSRKMLSVVDKIRNIIDDG